MADTIKVELKPGIRIRVRCKEDHAKPWLRRLYVVWAAVPPEPPPDSEPAESAQPQTFFAAQSDNDGYLSPRLNPLDPTPAASLPLFPDIDYHFYFVRFPDASFATDLVKELNADLAAAKEKWGEPHSLKAVLTQTGTDKAKKPIMEGILSVDEDPSWFLPPGADFYGGWLLFRDMPGTGSNTSDKDIQCQPLFHQVRRLQFHLGHLRYPIGNHYHPYSPEPWANTHKEDNNGRFPNEGVFETVTWNAVLRFQRDARAGFAAQLDPGKSRVPTLSSPGYDPLPAALDPKVQIKDSLNFLSDTSADPGDATAPIPANHDTIVDIETANAIRNWLDKDLRKPGKILVSRADWIPWIAWMQEDAYATIEELGNELASLHVEFTNGFQVNNAHRDTRMSVSVAGAGQAIYSIHKSGFAFDMAMDAFVAPRADAPLYFEKDLENSGARVKWIVYAPATAAKIGPGPFPDYVEYKDSINPWLYDPASPEGGATQPHLSLPGKKFLNFTKICDHYKLRRISAHPKGWQGATAVTHTLKDSDALASLINDIKFYLDRDDYTPTAVATIDGEIFPFKEFEGLYAHLSAWRQATAALNPSPTVKIEPWTKEGDKVIRALRSKALNGTKVYAHVDGFWSGGKGSSGFPPPPEPNQTPADGSGQSVEPPGPVEGTITLSPTAEFPTRSAFTLTPLTSPAQVKDDSIIELPALTGHPAHMEWWHFQYEPGYGGKKWGEILDLIGWTREGLLGEKGGMPIFGLYGLGYLPAGLDDDAN
jgi:hypothetical protein